MSINPIQLGPTSIASYRLSFAIGQLRYITDPEYCYVYLFDS